MEQILITPGDVDAAVLSLRRGSAVDAGAAAVLDLFWAGAVRRQLAALTSEAISGPRSATLSALSRPDIVLELTSKNPRYGTIPTRPPPEAAAWIAKRARVAPAPEPLFTEPMFRSALRALRSEVGGKVVLRDLRHWASFSLLQRAATQDAANALGMTAS